MSHSLIQLSLILFRSALSAREAGIEGALEAGRKDREHMLKMAESQECQDPAGTGLKHFDSLIDSLIAPDGGKTCCHNPGRGCH